MASTKQAATSRKRVSAENGNPARPSATSAANRVEEIRRRAYEIYEERGRQDGWAEQDWFRAEEELTAGNSRTV